MIWVNNVGPRLCLTPASGRLLAALGRIVEHEGSNQRGGGVADRAFSGHHRPPQAQVIRRERRQDGYRQQKGKGQHAFARLSLSRLRRHSQTRNNAAPATHAAGISPQEQPATQVSRKLREISTPGPATVSPAWVGIVQPERSAQRIRRVSQDFGFQDGFSPVPSRMDRGGRCRSFPRKRSEAATSSWP